MVIAARIHRLHGALRRLYITQSTDELQPGAKTCWLMQCGLIRINRPVRLVIINHEARRTLVYRTRSMKATRARLSLQSGHCIAEKQSKAMVASRWQRQMHSSLKRQHSKRNRGKNLYSMILDLRNPGNRNKWDSLSYLSRQTSS